MNEDKTKEVTPAAAETAYTTPSGAKRPSALVFTLKAIEIRLRFILLMLAIFFVVGYWETIKNYWSRWTRPAASANAQLEAGTELYCPMHPNVVRRELDPSGAVPNCPICGMPLSKRKIGEKAALPAGVTARVQFSPERIQLGGIATVEAAYRPLTKKLRTVGYVTYDESRLSRYVSRSAGYIEKLYVDKTWQTVRRDQPLAEIYSPMLYTAAFELAQSLEANIPEHVASARERLRRLGVDDREIDQVVANRQATHRLVLRALRDGYVIRKPIVEGAYVDAGATLFEIADLSVVWVEAEVYEADLPLVRVGQQVEAHVDAVAGRVFPGKVALIEPKLNANTRTSRVRIELSNPEGTLYPGMFATVHLQTPIAELEPFRTLLAKSQKDFDAVPGQSAAAVYICPDHPDAIHTEAKPCPKCQRETEPKLLTQDEKLIWWCPMHPEVVADRPGAECEECSGMKLIPRIAKGPQPGAVLSIPEPAVIDTGSRKIVYVEREPGLFDGIEVELGPRAEGLYAVAKGLEAGMRVAAAGAFLIDAETRLNPAAAAAYFGASGSPQSGKPSSQTAPSGEESTAPPAKQGTHEGHRDGTPTRRGKADTPSEAPAPLPAEALREIAHLTPEDQKAATNQRFCPISGEPLGSMGVPIKLVADGQALFVCCKGCQGQVEKEPAAALKKLKAQKPAAPPAHRH